MTIPVPRHVLVVGFWNATHIPVAWLAPQEDPDMHAPRPQDDQTVAAILPFSYAASTPDAEADRRDRVLRRILTQECGNNLSEHERFTSLIALAVLLGCDRYPYPPDWCAPAKWMLKFTRAGRGGKGMYCRIKPNKEGDGCKPLLLPKNPAGKKLAELLDQCMADTTDSMESDDMIPYHVYIQTAGYIGWRYAAKPAPVAQVVTGAPRLAVV